MRQRFAMRSNEQGTILIEFVGSFLLFFLLVISILSLVNIVTAQARMHYALTETANTLAMYGEVIHAADLESLSSGHDSSSTMSLLSKVFSVVSDLAGGGMPWDGSAPAGAVASLASYYSGLIPKTGFERVAKPLLISNLSAGPMSGEDYLRSVRIQSVKVTGYTVPYKVVTGSGSINLFGSSSSSSSVTWHSLEIDQKNGGVSTTDTESSARHRQMFRLTVEYEIDYSFMGLPLPFNPKLKVTQSVATRMWMGGSGEGYSG
jgi:hypothetical protein